MLPENLHDAIIELSAYINECFGNRVRIDYGTGHETSFVVWMSTFNSLQLNIIAIVTNHMILTNTHCYYV